MQKLLLRLVSIYLWWFSLVFVLATAFSSTNFLTKGTWLGDMLIRRPYQWDFELMFTVLFLIWGIFLWKASSNVQKNGSLIKFSAWAFLTHGLVFIIIGLIKQDILFHAIFDSAWWMAAGIILFKTQPNNEY